MNSRQIIPVQTGRALRRQISTFVFNVTSDFWPTIHAICVLVPKSPCGDAVKLTFVRKALYLMAAAWLVIAAACVEVPSPAGTGTAGSPIQPADSVKPASSISPTDSPQVVADGPRRSATHSEGTALTPGRAMFTPTVPLATTGASAKSATDPAAILKPTFTPVTSPDAKAAPIPTVTRVPASAPTPSLLPGEKPALTPTAAWTGPLPADGCRVQSQPPGAQPAPDLNPNGPYFHQVVVAKTSDGIHLTGARQVLEHASVPDGVRLRDGSVRIYYVNGARHGLWVAEMQGDEVTPIGPISLNGVSDPMGVVDPDATLMPDGTIRLAYLSGFVTRPQGPGDWSMCLADSRDGVNFNVLGRAIRFTEITTDPSLTQLTDGNWLMAVSQGTRSTLARSKDGLSFEAYKTVDYGAVPEITTLADGSVRLYVCGSSIWAYRSRDGGSTWQKEGLVDTPEAGKKIVCDPSLVKGAGLFVYKTGDVAPARNGTFDTSPRAGSDAGSGQRVTGSPSAGGPYASGGSKPFEPPACDTATPLSVSPIDLRELSYIVPLGNLNPSAHTFPTSHTYINYRSNAGAAPTGQSGGPGQQVAVRSPGEAYVVDLGVFETTPPGSRSYTEYKMELAVCGGIRLVFGHMGPIA
ncbi:MAG: hypothetical protein HY682_03825, partial [Chloroflexi bacterium]|nr:hypothetical protein [Chloroflexota bacterium]